MVLSITHQTFNAFGIRSKLSNIYKDGKLSCLELSKLLAEGNGIVDSDFLFMN